MSGFGKNSVSKFWKNKKLNVLDMGYTLIFIHNLFTKVQFYATTIVVMRRLLNYGISVSHTGCLYKFVGTIKMIQFNDEPFRQQKGCSNEHPYEVCCSLILCIC